MTFVLQCIAFFLTCFLLLNGHYIIGLLLIGGVCLFRNAYEYVFLALCIDLYFSPEPIHFWYTVMVVGILMAMHYLRPYIRTKEREVS